MNEAAGQVEHGLAGARQRRRRRHGQQRPAGHDEREHPECGEQQRESAEGDQDTAQQRAEGVADALPRTVAAEGPALPLRRREARGRRPARRARPRPARPPRPHRAVQARSPASPRRRTPAHRAPPRCPAPTTTPRSCAAPATPPPDAAMAPPVPAPPALASGLNSARSRANVSPVTSCCVLDSGRLCRVGIDSHGHGRGAVVRQVAGELRLDFGADDLDEPSRGGGADTQPGPQRMG
jgi:hypothetical protein